MVRLQEVTEQLQVRVSVFLYAPNMSYVSLVVVMKQLDHQAVVVIKQLDHQAVMVMKQLDHQVSVCVQSNNEHKDKNI